MNIRQGKKRFNQVREKFLAEPAERQARQGYSELGGGKISVEMGPDMFRKSRADVPFLHQSVELACANFNDRKFASDEKSIERNQRCDRRKLAENDGR